MRDVILEVPRVKWNDIGGMQDIIQKIRVRCQQLRLAGRQRYITLSGGRERSTNV